MITKDSSIQCGEQKKSHFQQGNTQLKLRTTCDENAGQHATTSVSNSRVPLIPHFDKPAFSRIPKNCEPQIVVEMFEEFVKRRVCQNGGGVAHGCFKWVSNRFGLRFFEKYLGNAFPNVRSTIQNLRLGSIKFAR
jgi:hypothetical protein